MKNKKNILLVSLLFIVVGFYSCKNEEDPILCDTAKARIDNEIDKYQSLLLESDGYWKLEYQVEGIEEPLLVLMRFENDGKVWMFTKLNKNVLQSTWRLTAEEGLVMSFDTYNFLHVLADPMNEPKGYGLMGDFEFIVDHHDADNIYTLGRKHHQDIVFERSSKLDWDAMNAVMDNEDALFDKETGSLFRVLKDASDKPILTLLFDPVNYLVSAYYYEDFDESKQFVYVPGVEYIIDSEALLFPTKLEVNDLSFDKLIFSEDKKELLSEDGNLKFVISHTPTTFYGAVDDLIHGWASCEVVGFSPTMGIGFQKLLSDFPRIEKVFISIDFMGSPGLVLRNLKKNGFFCGIEFDEDQFIGDKEKDIIRLIPTGEYNVFGIFMSQEHKDMCEEMLVSDGCRYIYQKLDENEQGSSVIPIGSNIYFIVSRYDSSNWVLVKKV